MSGLAGLLRSVLVRRSASRPSWFLVGGGMIVAALVVVAVAASLLAPYDPRAIAGEVLERPSARHLLGTDAGGHDIFSRLVWGTRASLTVAVGAGALAVAIAVLVGAGAGLVGGRLDTLAMRVVDALLVLPVLPFLILVTAMVGPSQGGVIVVIGILAWPALARLVRSQTLTLRQRGFVFAARGFGGGALYVLRRHLVPALGPIIVAGFLGVAGGAIFLQAGLAFLGLGDPGEVSWGAMLNEALRHPGLYYSPLWTWWVLPAAFAVTLAVLGLSFVGVGLETRFNPRARGPSPKNGSG